jgi:hypothetical protein
MPEAISDIPTNVWFFIAAFLVSVAAFVWLVLIPTLRSFGRPSEKVAASFLSLFLFATLVTVGVVGGMAYVFFSNDVSGIVPWSSG